MCRVNITGGECPQEEINAYIARGQQLYGREPDAIDIRLDGEYVEKLSFAFDVKCFFGTIKSVLKHDGVVEGGTGELHKEKAEKEKAESENEKAESENAKAESENEKAGNVAEEK